MITDENMVKDIFSEAMPTPVEDLSPVDTASNGINNYKHSRSIASQKSESVELDREALKSEYQQSLGVKQDPVADREKSGQEIMTDAGETEDPIQKALTAPTPSEALGSPKEAGKVIKSAVQIAAGGTLDAIQGTINTGLDFINLVEKQFGADFLADDAQVQALSNLVPASDKSSENAMRTITSFLIPFTGTMRALRAVGGASKVANMTKAAAVGFGVDMITDDPDNKNLAGLIQDTSLRGPVTEFLAGKGDARAVKRLKNGLIGSGLGAVADLTVGALSFVRAKRAAKLKIDDYNSAKVSPPDIPADAAEAIPAKIQDPDLPPLPEGPMIDVGSIKDKVTGKPFPGPRIKNLNLTKMDTPEDERAFVAAVLSDPNSRVMAEKRGVITNKELMKLAADNKEKVIDEVLFREVGQPLSAEANIVARAAETHIARYMIAMSKKVDDGLIDGMTYMSEIDKSERLLSHILGGRSETARSLGSSRLRASELTPDVRKAGQELIESGLGSGSVKRMTETIGGATEGQLVEAIGKSQTFGRKLEDVLYEVRINGLLSSPKTLMLNLVTNTTALANVGMETALGRGFAKIRGSGALKGQSEAYVQGLVGGWSDAWRAGAQSFKTGKTMFGGKKVDEYAAEAITANNVGAAGFFGKGVDMVGKTIRQPGRALLGTDEFFKALHYRTKVNMMAAEEANRRGLTGDAFQEFIDKSIKNPSPRIQSSGKAHAEYNTFTKALDNAPQKAVFDFIGAVPGGRVMIPFLRTSMNIAEYTADRLPMINKVPMTDKFFPNAGRMLKEGGVQKDLLHARWSMGTMALATGGALAYNGLITGDLSADPATAAIQKANGQLPYSIKIGDTHYAYNRMDPFGAMLGLSADLAQIGTQIYEDDETNMTDTAAAVALAVGNALTPEFLVENLGELTDIVLKQDTEAMARFATKFPSTLIPYSSAMRAVRNAEDPFRRETRQFDENGKWDLMQTAINEMKNTIPGLSAELPPKRNRFGEIIAMPMGYSESLLSPIATRKHKGSVVIEELVRLGSAGLIEDSEVKLGEQHLKIAQVPRNITVSTPIGTKNEKLTPQQRSEMAELAGGINLTEAIDDLDEVVAASQIIDIEDFSNPKGDILTFHNALKEQITSKKWKTTPDWKKKIIIKELDNAYVGMAIKVIKARYNFEEQALGEANEFLRKKASSQPKGIK